MLKRKTRHNKKAKIGTYLLLEVLGKGAFGTVYKAKDERTGVFVAIKVLKINAQKEDDAQFQKEIIALSAKNDIPNLAKILDYGIINGTPYLVMEFIPKAITMDRLLEGLHHRKMPLKLSVYLILQICEALSSLHQHGLIHTDLSPSNILIAPDAQTFLIDYTDAKSVESTIRPEVGTLPYAAPELVLRYRIQPNADIFSLGVIFYQAITGRLPFDVTKMDYRSPIPPRQLDTSIPVSINSIILRAIEINPDKRYQSIREFRDDLTEAAQEASLLVSREAAEVLLKELTKQSISQGKDSWQNRWWNKLLGGLRKGSQLSESTKAR